MMTSPERIFIRDEFGQSWAIDHDDELWDEVLAFTKGGTIDAILPLASIIDKRGWGWWSCFKLQDDWLKGLGIPIPDHKILDGAAGQPLAALAALLQEFGAYISFLEAQLGLIAGRRNALKQTYETAMAVRTAGYGKGSEKAKEAQVLSENETVRQVRRLYIETDMLYESAKGMTAGYQRAWETASRLVTIKTSEMELQPRRTL